MIINIGRMISCLSFLLFFKEFHEGRVLSGELDVLRLHRCSLLDIRHQEKFVYGSLQSEMAADVRAGDEDELLYLVGRGDVVQDDLARQDDLPGEVVVAAVQGSLEFLSPVVGHDLSVRVRVGAGDGFVNLGGIDLGKGFGLK